MLLNGVKNSRMRMKVQGRLMQARFIEIHHVFEKKVGYISNRVSTPNNKSQWFELQMSTAREGRHKKLRRPTWPAQDVVRTTKGLQGRTQLIQWDDGEIWKWRQFQFWFSKKCSHRCRKHHIEKRHDLLRKLCKVKRRESNPRPWMMVSHAELSVNYGAERAV